jgi:hypothetical protein
MKGGRPDIAFDVGVASASSTGLAILSSTSDGELAQESDVLQGSFFTYHLNAGLRGLADRNRDGKVTLGESFDYASEHTTNNTLTTSAGPQHPSFRYDLSGHGDFVVSILRSNAHQGFVVFDRPGWYFVRGPNGRLIAEVQSSGSGPRLALETGQYELLRRDSRTLARSELRIYGGADVGVSSLTTTSVSLGRAVRKGSLGPSHATTLQAGATWRNSLVGLGPWWGSAIAVKVDFELGSLEAGFGYARAIDSTRVESDAFELRASLGGMRAFDFSFGTVAAGAHVGWAALHQRVEWLPPTTTHAGTLAPLAILEIPLGLRLSMRGDISTPLYLLRVASSHEDSSLEVAPSMQLGLGLGVGL